LFALTFDISHSAAFTCGRVWNRPQETASEASSWAGWRFAPPRCPIDVFLLWQGSQATWLNSALPKLAEIIRLQDLGAVKIEVATLATMYPDIRKRHLEAFLYIKANLSRSELKSILGYLADSTASLLPKAPLFSDINVS
uniref:Uncharacterized protein n=1 Tax=Strigops habroptila TaxID=2489341 RepID=A0A672UHE1_STRHB